MADVEIVRLEGTARTTITDRVADEVPFTIRLNGSELVTLLASPENLKELAYGFMYTSGIILGAADVKDLRMDGSSWTADISLARKIPADLVFKRIYTPGCGRGIQFISPVDLLHRGKMESGLSVTADALRGLLEEFRERSDEYRETGGVHGAATSDGARILEFMTDIGRHNALDKALGAALLGGLPMADLLVITSGRISSEIVLKLVKAGIPMAVSRGAPTNQAVMHARGAGMTLVGFARGTRMNIYCLQERVL
jgi:FdhD protein